MEARLEHPATVLAFLPNFVSSVELLLKHGSDHSKGSQRSPTRFKFAAPANSMTLALHLHIPLQKLSACFVVVEIHERNWIFGFLSALPSITSINKCSREGDAEIYIVRASRPLKSLRRHSSQRSVTSAVLKFSTGASPGHCMSHPSA